jgi:hypothetical protein
MDGGKDWIAIAALVPGRTKLQYHKRWHNTLNNSNDRATGRSGTWTENADIVRHTIKIYGG